MPDIIKQARPEDTTSARHVLPHLGAVEAVTQGGDAGKHLLPSLAKGLHGLVAQLPQQEALQHRKSCISV